MTQMTTSDLMTYTHMCAWRVIGGIGMLPGSDNITLASGDGWSYLLTNNLDATFAICDRGLALGHLALQGIFGPEKVGTLEERLASEIDEIRQERHKKAGGYPMLLFIGHAETNVTISEKAQQRDDYILTFDAFDKSAIRQKYVHQHRAMQLALALGSKRRVRFDEATSGTYCTNVEGHMVYSLSFSGGNADLIVSSPLTPEVTGTVAQRFALLSKAADFESTVRLFSDMAIYGREPFRVFISGWAALEILIKKSFKEYEKQFFSALTIPHQPEMAATFLERIRQVMNDKHNLIDRFTLVSSVLLPSQNTDEAEADLTTFKRIKKQRDEIAHGAAFDESLLPVDELSALLMKYLTAHTTLAAV